jgi:hypothetical protein
VDLLATQAARFVVLSCENFFQIKYRRQKSCSLTPFAATKQMVGGVLLLVNLGLKLYSELKQTTVIKNKK